MDQFQERYLEHKERKTNTLDNQEGVLYQPNTKEELETFKKILLNRRSQRIFNKEEITKEEIELLEQAIIHSPSSCNRQAIYIKYVDPYIAEQYLVGGKRWSDKANKVMLVFASRLAYKNPAELPFMPYLDAGFVGQSVYLMAEALNIGCCFVNPNIREENKDLFNQIHNKEDDYFCGAIILGKYDIKAKQPPLRKII